MDWTNEAIERLRAFWTEGHSTAEIGRRMGITKNAVVGKAHRLQLSARPSPIHRDANAPRPMPSGRRAAPLVPPLALPLAPMHRTGPIAIAEVTAAKPASTLSAAMQASPAPAPLRAPAPMAARVVEVPRASAVRPMAAIRPFPRSAAKSCCWPLGEPGTAGFRFCSADSSGGKPYCAEHNALAYVRVRDRREDAA